MPPTCTICRHPNRAEIEAALASRTPLRNIAVRYGTSLGSISRHRNDCLSAACKQALEAKAESEAVKSGETVLSQIESIKTRIMKMLDACEEWLTDPETGKFDLGPRADDVKVFYRDGIIRKKDSLQRLLDRLSDGGIQHYRWETKHADPRKLILETALVLRGHLELCARLTGELDTRPQVNILVLPEWISLRDRIVQAVAQFPEARAAILAALPGNGGPS